MRTFELTDFFYFIAKHVDSLHLGIWMASVKSLTFILGWHLVLNLTIVS